MFGTTEGKEEPKHITYSEFQRLFASNPDESSPLGGCIEAIRYDLIEKGDAERMMQEGAELDHVYVKTLESIGGALEEENFTFNDLSQLEALALKLIDEEYSGSDNPAFAAYMQHVQDGNPKLEGMK